MEFLRGQIEAIPLPDQSVDMIISNCVINLSADRPAVFAESFRVLRPRRSQLVAARSHARHLTRSLAGQYHGCLATGITCGPVRRRGR